MTKPKPLGEPIIRYNYELLKTFCSQNNIIICDIYKNTKITRDTRIDGKCLTETCNHIFDKSFCSLIKTNGYCKKCIKNRINKERKKNIDNIKYKQTETCFKKYGVAHFFETEEFKTKSKKTWINKYGVDNPIKSKEIQKKRIKLFIEKYGVENPSQLETVQNIKKINSIKKYGVEYPNQNSEIAEKVSKNSYRRKLYVFPSGKQDYVQGYEPFALDKLIKEELIEENDIITGCKNVPTIWYNDDNNKKHRHYVDIFIPSQNRCIEVKSTWTAKQKQDNIFLKQNASKELGYLYEIWIYNNKGEIVECHK